MGAPIIGRTACPECGFESAHVKRSAKCLYRYCPECGAMYHATGAERERRLMERTRLAETAGPTPTPTGDVIESPATPPADPGPTPTWPTPSPEPEPTPTPTPAPAPAPAPRRRAGFFTI